MKFALYLAKKGIITSEQLVSALDCQHSKLAPIGQLAMEEGILSARDVFKILRCQSGMPHERFGEVAVGMGMMTPAQLQRLLAIQAERKPSLADVLVRQGMLSLAQVDEQLAAYRQEMQRRNVVIRRTIPAPSRLPSRPGMLDDAEVRVLMV